MRELDFNESASAAPEDRRSATRLAWAAGDDGFTMIAATLVLSVVLMLGTAVMALANRNVEQTVQNRDVLRAQLAAEGALDSAQYRLAKTAGGLVGNGNGGAFISLRKLDSSLANALCISVSLGADKPLVDVGNSTVGMCPEGDWEKLGDDTRMLVRQQQLGLLKPNSIVSRIVVGIGQSGRPGHTITRRMIMRLELKLDDLGGLSLIRRRGVALCKGGYVVANPAQGCPQPPPPPTNVTGGDPTPFDPAEPVDTDPNSSNVPVVTLVPHVDGTPELGETLNVIPGQWRNLSADAVRSYQWYRCGATTNVCTAVAGAAGTNLRYSLPASEYGDVYRWKVLETVTNHPGKSNQQASSAWSLATNGGQAHAGSVFAATTRSPRITGTPVAGQTLTADRGTWAARGTTIDLLNLFPDDSHTWYRCPATGSPDPASANPQSVAGCASRGSAATYKLDSTDVNTRLRIVSTKAICSGLGVLGICIGTKSANSAVSQATPIVKAAG